MTTTESSQSQNRNVGPRNPFVTELAITSSSAACFAAGSVTGGITVNSWSSQLLALPSARRTAVATASAEKPNIITSSSSASSIAVANVLWLADTGKPFNASLICANAE